MATPFQVKYPKQTLIQVFSTPQSLILKNEYLSIAEHYHSIQRYCHDLSKSTAVIPQPIVIDNKRYDFWDVKVAYEDIGILMKQWDNTILPTTVQVANELLAFCDYMERMFDRVVEAASAGNKGKVVAILNQSASMASQLANNASYCTRLLLNLLNSVKTSIYTLEGLQQKYTALLGTSAQIEKLRKDIIDANANKDKANKDYEYYCTVAGTSASYAWIWPFGTIAAGAVAGTYGSKATQAKKDAEMWANEAQEAQKKLDTIQHNNVQLDILFQTMNQLVEGLQKSQSNLENYSGQWTAIASGMSGVEKGINESLKEVDDLYYLQNIFSMDMGAVKLMWRTAKEVAQNYVASLLIKVL